MTLNKLESPRSLWMGGGWKRLKTMKINAAGEDETLIMLFRGPNCSSLENSAVGRQDAHTQMLRAPHLPLWAPR